MKISEAGRRSGLSAHTIRYYEASDMMPTIVRGPDGHRSFTPETVDWLILLASLRNTGMPVKTMRQFAALYRQGDVTVRARKQMLEQHHARLKAQQAQLADCCDLLAYKLARYSEILGESG